jgi:YVTN family beta-propeller protein
VDVGSNPFELLYNPVNDKVYVADITSDTVSVINSQTDEVDATINVGDSPRNLIYNPENGDVYVANIGTDIVSPTDTVSVINSQTDEVDATITVGDTPVGLAYNSDNNQLYVANGESDNVSVIDTISNTVIKTITVGDSSVWVTYNPDFGKVYVTNGGNDSVSVIDTSSNTVIETINVGDTPRLLFYNSENNRVYIANFAGGTISVIQTEAIINPDVSETTITQASDEDGNEISQNGFVRVGNSISFDIETIIDANNDEETEGIICTLDGEPFDDCVNLFSDNPIDNAADRKSCILEQDETGTYEVCEMTVTIPNLSKTYHEFTVSVYEGSFNPPVPPTITKQDDTPDTFSWFVGESLETAILEVRDGNNEIVNFGETINTNSIFIDMEIRNINDVEGVICFLNGVQYDECDRFDDPIDDPNNDEKQCREIVVNERTYEICTFTIKINNLEPGNYDFSVAAFYVAALNQIEDEKFTNNFAISTREETSDQSKYDQSTNEMPLNFT